MIESPIRYRLVVAVAAASALLAAGCMRSEPMAPGEMDRYWRLAPDVSADANFYRATVEDRRIPSRWTLRRQESVIWSTVSILQAVDRIEEGAAEVDLGISPVHAETLAEVVSEVRGVLESLDALAKAGAEGDSRRWARGVADALLQVESVARLVGRGDPDAPLSEEESRTSLAGGPLLRLVAGYLDRRAAGGLLSELGEGQIDQIRVVFTQIVLKLSFVAAGKELSPEVREEVAGRLAAAEDLPALRGALEQTLLRALDRAEPAPSDTALRSVVDTALGWAPKGLRVFEGLIRQWENVDRVVFELREVDGGPVVAATIAIRPGREVVVPEVMIFQPKLIFTGTSRVAVLGDAAGAGSDIVRFRPAGDGGAVQLRFEGIAYVFARLLAMPLADGALREVRVKRSDSARGSSLLNVAVLMEADHGADPRRMIVYQDGREKTVRRSAFDARSLAVRTVRGFNYVTPDRRYVYLSLDEEPPEAAGAAEAQMPLR
jgi:hypothetical protein